MQKAARRVVVLSAAAGLCACVSSPPPSTLPANAALENAMVKLLDQPSYRVRVSGRINHVAVSTDRSPTTATGQMLGSLPVPKPEADKMTGDARSAIQIGVDLMGTLFQRMEFTGDGVFDFRHGQFELTPTMTYKAANAGAYIRVPIMLDMAAGQGYVDLSALSPVLVNASSDGKYSSFSLKPFTERVDLKKLLHWSRDLSLDMFTAMSAANFRDLPLEPADTAAGAVRKIELAQSLDEFHDAVRSAADAHKAEFREALLESDNSVVLSLRPNAGVADAVINALIGLGEPSAIDKNHSPVANMRGTMRMDYLLDRAGNIIGASYYADASSSIFPVSTGVEMEARYSDFGNAEVSFRPTADNTIPYDESSKGSMVYAIRSMENNNKRGAVANGARPGSGVVAGNNVLVGAWERTDSDGCTSTYDVTSNFSALFTSGKDIAYTTYALAPAPDQQGFYRFTERRAADNGQKDCAGNIAPKNMVVTSYLQFNPAKTMLRMCSDETLSHCSQLARVPDDKP